MNYGSGYDPYTNFPTVQTEIVESTGYGIISGGAVTAQSTPNMTVQVAAPTAHMPSGARFTTAAISALAINAADTVNPRIDLIYLAAANAAITYLPGTLGSTPTAGSMTYTITTNFNATDTVTIDGVTLTAVASGATGLRFNVGSTIASTAANLQAALVTATSNAVFTATVSGAVITLTETVPGSGNTPIAAAYIGTGVVSSGTAIISTPAAVAPALPTGTLGLSNISVAAGTTAIQNTKITDIRKIKPNYQNFGSVSVKDFFSIGDADDTASINRALFYMSIVGGGKVRMPYRVTPYSISSTLLIYSNTTLDIDEFAMIQLANNSNCRMLENAHKSTQTTLTRIDKNIKVVGGIWDGNGDEQTKMIADGGSCTGFLFSGVDHLEFKPTKIKDTQTYGCWFCNVKNLLIENMEISIDPPAEVHNQDGIHIQGPSTNITIRDCILKANDNVIALNADDVAQGTYSTTGDITNVYIDNIVFNNTYQGMLLLSGTSLLDNVIIKNITGSANYFVQMKTWGLGPGNYGNITFENINILLNRFSAAYVDYYSIIEGNIENLKFRNIRMPKGDGIGYRIAFNIQTDTGVNTVINNLTFDGFESNTVSGEGVNYASCPIYVNSNVTINNLKLANFVNKQNRSSAGIYPIQLNQCTINSLIMQNFDWANAKTGVLWISGTAVIGNIIYDKIIVDTTLSANVLNVVYGPTVNSLKITNSGNVQVTQDASIGTFNMDYIYKGSTLPTNLFWHKGDILYNSSPASAGYLGWVCTTEGQAANSQWAANTAYTVGTRVFTMQSSTVSGAVFVCAVAGTSGSTMPSTWSGNSTDGTVTWTFVSAPAAIFKTFGLISS